MLPSGHGSGLDGGVAGDDIRINGRRDAMVDAVVVQHSDGVYNRVPPVLSRHGKRDFSRPKQRSTTQHVLQWALLYAISARQSGFPAVSTATVPGGTPSHLSQ